MTDLAKWKVRGEVRSLKTSFAEWDLASEEWRGPRYHNEATFRPDGKLDEARHFNPDGTIARTKNLYDEGGLFIEAQFWKDDSLQSQTLYTYDAARRHVRTVSLPQDGKEQEAETSTYDSRGRKTTVRFLYPPEGGGHIAYWIEGADQGISVPGAVTKTTIHDPNHLAAEVLFHDAQNALVGRVVLTRDESARLVKAEFQFGDLPPFPEAAAQGEKAGVPMAELLAKVFGPSPSFCRTTYSYDEHGLLAERATEMGLLSGDRAPSVTTSMATRLSNRRHKKIASSKQMSRANCTSPKSGRTPGIPASNISTTSRATGRSAWSGAGWNRTRTSNAATSNDTKSLTMGRAAR